VPVGSHLRSSFSNRFPDPAVRSQHGRHPGFCLCVQRDLYRQRLVCTQGFRAPVLRAQMQRQQRLPLGLRMPFAWHTRQRTLRSGSPRPRPILRAQSRIGAGVSGRRSLRHVRLNAQPDSRARDKFRMHQTYEKHQPAFFNARTRPGLGRARALLWGLALAVITLQTLPSQALGKDLQGVVNINEASAHELEQLPGIGPSKSERIIHYRKKHRFRSVAQLVRIRGLGHKSVRKLRPFVTVTGPTTLTTDGQAPVVSKAPTRDTSPAASQTFPEAGSANSREANPGGARSRGASPETGFQGASLWALPQNPAKRCHCPCAVVRESHQVGNAGARLQTRSTAGGLRGSRAQID